ncbi:MAG TPA: ferritin-like domain-containing protein [Candidatus Thermoplasmatota archaeon]|nr:ferritin-like domain-containing protein [Candidatus Thermoplasmatota archaeon]
MAKRTLDERALDDRVAIAELNRLIEREANAVALLDVACAVLGGEARVEALEAFRSDHERHADRLAAAARAVGGATFQPSGPTALGRFEAIALLGEMDTAGVLRALVVHERLALAAYERRLEAEFPAEARDALEEAADDERRHLEWVREAADDASALAVASAAAPKP